VLSKECLPPYVYQTSALELDTMIFNVKRVANLLHVSAYFGHIQRNIQQTSFQRIPPSRWPKKAETCRRFTTCFMLLYLIIKQLLKYAWLLVLLNWASIILNVYIFQCSGKTSDFEKIQNKVTALYITSFVLTALVVLNKSQVFCRVNC
jgi:hypothetical protein